MTGDGIFIEESEFTKLNQKNQLLVIFKVCQAIMNDNGKLKTRQKLLALSQAGIYVLVGWIVYLHFQPS